MNITKGTAISIPNGELIVTGYNGSVVFCKEYQLDDDDNLVLRLENSMWTRAEIAAAMKELDGKNHTVTWRD